MTAPDQRPNGLAFLDLGERLRQRGQLDMAASVAEAGLARYPGLADAHDLLGRIRADQGRDADARAAWEAVLDLERDHVGALKGLAYLAFRRHDLAEAERRLDVARRIAPHDPTILAALDRVRSALPSAPVTVLRLDDPAAGLLLADAEGLRLAGGLGDGGESEADGAAAMAVGLGREAGRAARFLELGAWRHLVLEGPRGRCVVLPVGEAATLLVRRAGGTPLGRLLADAQRGADAARAWMEATR